MPELTKETVSLLGFLAPGFLLAWALHALTSPKNTSQLERIVRALIFTLFVRVLVIGEKSLLELIGRYFPIRPWDTDAELLASLATALALGLMGALIINTDWLHKKLRNWRISRKSSHSSEWCGVFHSYELFVTIHYKDGRRLKGWPGVWPSDPLNGHFFIMQPEWIHTDPPVKMNMLEGILVDSADIKHVEFLKPPEELLNDK